MGRSGYLIGEGFRNVGKHGFMSFASVTIMMACMIIMGSFALLSLNIDMLIDDLEDQNEVVCFIDETLSDDEAMALQSQLMQTPNVESVEFVSREEAMTAFMSNYSEDLMEGIDEGVFRHRYVIHLEDIAEMNQTKVVLENIDGIAKVNCHTDYAKKFVTLRNIVTAISMVLIVILVFVSLFIMSNTIKLATYGRREEIAIMKMVGATNAFIRLPFIVEGLILGLLAGALGFVALWGLYELVTGQVISALTGNYITIVEFTSVWKYILVSFMGLGVFVGVFGGMNAIKNYLKV